MSQEMPYQISDIARQADVSLRTVRFYQQQGLITASLKTSAGMRLYSAYDVNRVKQIRRLKDTGMSLNQIKALLDPQEDHDRKSLVENTLKILQTEKDNNQKRIAELKQQGKEREEIVKLIKNCVICEMQTCPGECPAKTQIIR